MAVTKIHAIKKTLQVSIDYICNPDKTDGCTLVSSFACSPKTAHLEFDQALRAAGLRKNSNLAYHLIQSFAPGEITPEQAHEIGVKFADRILEGKYSYVCATHMDRDHIHSHIIFCAADNLEHKKYNDCRASYYRIRTLNDDICREYGLPVVIPSDRKGLDYSEWKAKKEGRSWKARLKKDIDQCIRNSDSYEEFLSLMLSKGYEIKGESLDIGPQKYISFRPSGKERFIRGSAKTLGADYTKQAIAYRIDNNNLNRGTLSSRETPLDIIDTTAKRFENKPWLKRWANLQNLKLIAGKYSEIESLMSLSDNLEAASANVANAKKALALIDKRLKHLGEAIKYAHQYEDNLSVRKQYQKSKAKEQVAALETELGRFNQYLEKEPDPEIRDKKADRKKSRSKKDL